MKFVKLREDWLVNIDCIESIKRNQKGMSQVTMESGDKEIVSVPFETLESLLSKEDSDKEINQHFRG